MIRRMQGYIAAIFILFVLGGCNFSASHPNETKIKTDLLGRSIANLIWGPVFHIESLSHYEVFKAEKIQGSGDIVKYKVHLVLKSNTSNYRASADLIIVYHLDDKKWRIIEIENKDKLKVLSR